MVSTTSQTEAWTVLGLITRSADNLAPKGIEDARLNVELLLAHILQCTRLDLYLRFDKLLTPGELAEFKTLIRRRLAHEPIQYILGSTEFMGLKFKVDSRALIPRPDTETLVEAVIDHIQRLHLSHPRILDIGTGTGNIAISLAHHIPHALVFGIDRSAEAIVLAQENVRLNRLTGKVSFSQADVMSESLTQKIGTFDLIVSNPPYIPQTEYDLLAREIREFEPADALTDHGDGLTVCRSIIGAVPLLLKTGGYLFLEIGHDQQRAVAGMLGDAGYMEIGSIKDLNGIQRVMKARRG